MALTFFLSKELLLLHTGSEKREIGVQLNYTYYSSRVSERRKLSQTPGEPANIITWDEKAPFTQGNL